MMQHRESDSCVWEPVYISNTNRNRKPVKRTAPIYNPHRLLQAPIALVLYHRAILNECKACAKYVFSGYRLCKEVLHY